MTPKNCIECEYSKTCTDAYYGGTTCRHYYDMIEAIFGHSDVCHPVRCVRRISREVEELSKGHTGEIVKE